MSPVLALYLQVFGRNPSSKTSTSVVKESKGANDINENLEGIVDRMSCVQIGKDNSTEDQEGKGDFFGLQENIQKLYLVFVSFLGVNAQQVRLLIWACFRQLFFGVLVKSSAFSLIVCH